MDRLKMTYKTDSGKSTSITLNGVRPGITGNDVNELMDDFVGSGAVRTRSGKVTEKVSCELRKVTSYPYDLS